MMSIRMIPVGAILEDMRTNTIFEITETFPQHLAERSYYTYGVNILYNPQKFTLTTIRVATVDQLNTLYFYNVDNVPDDLTGFIKFVITTMSVEDVERLIDTIDFMDNYFNKSRTFMRFQKLHRTRIKAKNENDIHICRKANFIEKFLYGDSIKKDDENIINKQVSITDLFTSYRVNPLAILVP